MTAMQERSRTDSRSLLEVTSRARSLSPLNRTSSATSSQTKASEASCLTEESTRCGSESSHPCSLAQEKSTSPQGAGCATEPSPPKQLKPDAPEDWHQIPAYPFPAEFKLEFDDDQHINVISHLCKSPKGPSTIAFLLPGVHGGVGPCRQPGSNFDSSCLYAMLAERLLDTSDAIDVYRISWQFMRPGLEYALNSICRVLHYALKKARHRGSTSIRVVFVGHSLGAQVAVHAAYVLSRLQADGHAFLGKAGESMSMDVRGLCTLNAPVNKWEVAADVQKALVPLKALLVSGDADEVVKPRSTKKLFKALRCKDKRHLELAGGTHDLFQYKDLLTEEVSQFILDIAEEPA